MLRTAVVWSLALAHGRASSTPHDSKARIIEQFNIVATLVPNCVVLLVGTHSDQVGSPEEAEAKLKLLKEGDIQAWEEERLEIFHKAQATRDENDRVVSSSPLRLLRSIPVSSLRENFDSILELLECMRDAAFNLFPAFLSQIPTSFKVLKGLVLALRCWRGRATGLRASQTPGGRGGGTHTC